MITQSLQDDIEKHMATAAGVRYLRARLDSVYRLSMDDKPVSEVEIAEIVAIGDTVLLRIEMQHMLWEAKNS